MYAQRELAEAVESYRRVVALRPGHGAAQRSLAIALLTLDRPCEALAHLRAARDIVATVDAELLQTLDRVTGLCEAPAVQQPD